MLREFARFESAQVLIRLADGTSCGLPAWMLDEASCAMVRDAERPSVDSRSLLRLAALLDSQGRQGRSRPDEDHTNLSPTKRLSPAKPSAQLAAGGSQASEPDPGSNSTEVPRATAAVAWYRRARGERRHA